MKTTVLDLGIGNLHSLAKALARSGAAVRLETEPARALDTDLLVLPGVGAFAAAAARLAPDRERVRAALAAGLPCLGICLGMQLLFEASEEGAGAGLGRFGGRVTRLTARRVPQIGWNAIEPATQGAPFATAPLAYAYFANGYACRPDDPTIVTAWVEHDGDRFPAAVRQGRVMGVQFHPEKSSEPGVAFLAAAVEAIGGVP